VFVPDDCNLPGASISTVHMVVMLNILVMVGERYHVILGGKTKLKFFHKCPKLMILATWIFRWVLFCDTIMLVLFNTI